MNDEDEFYLEVDLNQFEKIRKLGEGGYGKAFLVKNKQNSKFYAAKVLTKKDNMSPEEIEKAYCDFKKEAKILEKFEHPCILHYYGFSSHDFNDKPRPTIITEYAEYESLDEALEKKRKDSFSEFNDTIKYIIMYGIARGMEFLHQHNVIHRDLKPLNIFLNQFLFPIIGDFGLAKIADPKNNIQNIRAGTCIYQAPEIFNSDTVTEKIDIYAYGIILYEIVTGKIPFKHINEAQFSLNVTNKNKRPEFPKEGIDEKMKSLIQRCWDKNPKARPPFTKIIKILEDSDMIKRMKADPTQFNNYVKIVNCSRKTFYEDASKTFISYDKIIKTQMEKSIKLYPYQQFLKLSTECQNFVLEAEKGDSPQKIYQLAQNLIYGKNGFPHDSELGMQYLTLAENYQYSPASVLKGVLLYEGKYVPKNILKAKEALNKRFLHRDYNSILYMAKIELEEKEPNYQKVKEDLVDLSTYNLNTEAMVLYGKLCMKETQNGKLKRDFQQSFEYFKKAAKKEDAEGLAYYGLFYYYGYGVVDYNFEKAADLFQESYDKGSMTGAAFLSECYAKGRGVTKDGKRAVELARESKQHGNNTGKNKYGIYLNQGLGDLEINKKESCRLWKETALEGDAEGSFLYANCLVEGDEYRVKRNIEEAIKYYRESISGGNLTAMASYGYILIQGQFSDQNIQEGLGMIEFAANHGDDFAIAVYSHMLINGIGVNIDIGKAKKYLDIGKSRGIVDCYYMYSELVEQDYIPNKGQEEIEKCKAKAIHSEYDIKDSDDEDFESNFSNGCLVL